MPLKVSESVSVDIRYLAQASPNISPHLERAIFTFGNNKISCSPKGNFPIDQAKSMVNY